MTPGRSPSERRTQVAPSSTCRSSRSPCGCCRRMAAPGAGPADRADPAIRRRSRPARCSGGPEARGWWGPPGSRSGGWPGGTAPGQCRVQRSGVHHHAKVEGVVGDVLEGLELAHQLVARGDLAVPDSGGNHQHQRLCGAGVIDEGLGQVGPVRQAVQRARERHARQLGVTVGVHDAHQVEGLEALRVERPAHMHTLDPRAPERSVRVALSHVAARYHVRPHV